MMKHFSSKTVFRRELYINYIFTIFIENNCITMSRIFRIACLEKYILEIALAASYKRHERRKLIEEE